MTRDDGTIVGWPPDGETWAEGDQLVVKGHITLSEVCDAWRGRARGSRAR